MPSFLSKLFRKKKGPDEGPTNVSKGISKKSRKSSKKKSKVDMTSNTTSSKQQPVVSNHAPQKPLREPQELRRPSNGGTSNYSSNSGSEPHVRVLSPRNQAPSNNMSNLMDNELTTQSLFPPAATSAHQIVKRHPESDISNNHGWGGPVDLDESDLGSDTDENQVHSLRKAHETNQAYHHQSQSLSVQQLRRFDMQQQKREAKTQFYMPREEPRFSAGHVPVDDLGNRSDASSSSFNLSTDAEDTEYEALKRRGVVPHHAPALDSSHLSGVSSPTNYNTDGDNSIFPALQTDDEGTATERESQPGGGSNMKASTTDEDEEDDMNRAEFRNTSLSNKMHHLSISEDDEDARAWTLSPTKDGSNPFPFHNPASPTPRRNFTSPRVPRSPKTFSTSALTTTENNNNNDFANFADFSNVTFPADNESWGAPKANTNVSGIAEGSPMPPVSPGKKTHRTSFSAAELTLSDILNQAKEKKNSTGSQRSTGSVGGGHRRVSSSSVNSAPAITAKYLRQHHNLRPARNSSDHHDGTTPVSDIIDSLEMANASRSSQHSIGGGSHGRSASRSSQSRDRRRSAARRRNDPNHSTESDGSDQEGSESWLFDEVTGALGPRGIAADLESLSGRSKSSSGNKSHKSHKSHRSHRSHGRTRRRKSSSKHHPSSGESVDSRGSRHSRSSRYSHRSTRSYLSQMSEQSRSVANDLLRLEMQLAMVGSQDNNAAAAAGSSASVASRASRKSRSSARRTVAIARRNKVTIQAPPGKLGIILANKADSKGTVVSGVRSSSVLSEKISPGDRIVAIDGEDVSLMTVSEITTIMARKSDFERTLTVLTTPKHLTMPSGSSSGPTAETSARNSISSPSNKSGEYDSYHHRYGSGGR